MTKYTVASQRRARREEQTLSPVWRGVGCLLILFVPLLSYFLAVGTVHMAVDQKWPMPYQIMGYPVMPAVLMKLPGLIPLLTFVQAQQDLYAILLITVLYIVAIGAFMSFVYSFIYKYVGPPRYGPLDMPPPKVAPRRYKR
jgi:hypothetical protein